MKEIKVKNLTQLFNVLCLLLGEELIKNSKISRRNMGQAKFSNAIIECYTFETKNKEHGCVVDFFIDEKNEFAEVFVYYLNKQYNIIVDNFPEYGFLHMDIIYCFFDDLTEEEIKEAENYINNAKEDIYEE